MYFNLKSDFLPQGDQPRAIDELVLGIEHKMLHQVLLGVTGSGKTYTIANVLSRVQKSALIIAHNKTLVGQLYFEFKQFFPDNAVGFFVSYYDYYQPEAYVPQSDTYIEKDASINDEIDRMRHKSTHYLLTQSHVIIVASVSCIFGLGPVENYGEMRVRICQGKDMSRDQLLRRLVEIQYSRNDLDFHRGTFRVCGDVVDIFPVYEEKRALRVSFWGDEVESMSWFDPLKAKSLEKVDAIDVYPGSHYVTPGSSIKCALHSIREELRERLVELRTKGRLLEAQRLEQRTLYDLEMLEQVGYCHGIENYSRHLSGREPGTPPQTLIDYLPSDSLIVIDESHQTLPQLKGMFRSDRSRKQTLVDYGFRLPSALDNRPLTYEEFASRVGQCIYVSATPTKFEIDLAQGVIVEQIIRPTGLMDPKVFIRSANTQVDDLIGEIRTTVASGSRVMVTTLTKRMSEDLTDFLTEHGIRVQYLHSDIKTLERLEIVRSLRAGKFDVLVGINLLREGLDIPEVALVAILDADREGFLRSECALIQTMGRASRNDRGRVILYAEKITQAITHAREETLRRRNLQQDYNHAHNITPRTIQKSVIQMKRLRRETNKQLTYCMEDAPQYIHKLERQMKHAASQLDFERAAQLRDQIAELKRFRLFAG